MGKLILSATCWSCLGGGRLWFWGALLVGDLVAGLFGNMLRETAVVR